VVDRDAGQHRAVGVDCVDRVEASAEPHLEHGRLDLPFLEEPERRQGAELEIGQRRAAARRLDRCECLA